jgi:hypothetical protein
VSLENVYGYGPTGGKPLASTAAHRARVQQRADLVQREPKAAVAAPSDRDG